jgi:hypothetical protein
MTTTQLDSFTRAYLVAALWTFDDDAPSGDYESSGRIEILLPQIAPESIESAAQDCARFLDYNRARIETALLNEEQAGHDFWLSRNGNGSGFFERAYDIGRSDPAVVAACNELQDDARKWGESDLYRGDDGKLHLS